MICEVAGEHGAIVLELDEVADQVDLVGEYGEHVPLAIVRLEGRLLSGIPDCMHVGDFFHIRQEGLYAILRLRSKRGHVRSEGFYVFDPRRGQSDDPG